MAIIIIFPTFSANSNMCANSGSILIDDSHYRLYFLLLCILGNFSLDVRDYEFYFLYDRYVYVVINILELCSGTR